MHTPSCYTKLTNKIWCMRVYCCSIVNPNKFHHGDLGLEEFAQQLEDWNKSLAELEKFLSRNVSEIKSADMGEGLDQVDVMDVAGFHNSGLIYEKVDTTLNNVVSKIGQLRYKYREKYC